MVVAEEIDPLIKEVDDGLSKLASLIPNNVMSGDGGIEGAKKERIEKEKQLKISSHSKAINKTRKKKKKNAKRKLPPNAAKIRDPELQKKLEDKLQVLRAARKADDPTAKDVRLKKKSKKVAKQKEKEGKKRKSTSNGNEDADQEKKKSRKQKDGTHKGVPDELKDVPQTKEKKLQKSPKKVPNGPDISFNTIKGLDEPKMKNAIPKKPKKDLGKILENANNEKLEIQMLKSNSDPEAQEKLKQKLVEKAITKAKGEKVLDNPTLLKKKIKKEEKAKKKSAEEWKQRKKSQEKELKERIAKREKNIQERNEIKKANRATGKKSKRRR